MGLHAEPPRPERTRKVRAADVGSERQVIRDGIERVDHGALICPSCHVPVVLEQSVPAGEALACGYCSHESRARDFLVPDVYDTVGNEVYLIARITA